MGLLEKVTIVCDAMYCKAYLAMLSLKNCIAMSNFSKIKNGDIAKILICILLKHFKNNAMQPLLTFQKLQNKQWQYFIIDIALS